MVTCLVIDDASPAELYIDGSSRTTKRRSENAHPAPVRKILVASRNF
jgi:hypothetical protein